MIKKINNKFCTIHCHGKDKGKIISCFPTKKEALAQHKAIMANKIEINLNLLKDERGTHEGYVTVHRNGKIFQRKQRLGQKEKEKNISDLPNKKLFEGIKKAIEKRKLFDKEYGFQSISKNGIFTYKHAPTLFENKLLPDLHFKIEGTNFINLDTGAKISIPDRFITRISDNLAHGNLDILKELDIKMAGTGRPLWYNEVNAKQSKEIEEIIKQYDNYKPILTEIKGEGGKYSSKFHLKYVSNIPEKNISKYVGWPLYWYDGNEKEAAFIGKAATDIINGKFDKNNIYHPLIKIVQEISKKINEKYGADIIYRGETNPITAKEIIKNIIETGKVELADKMFSTTENEKLAKWYASVHGQENPRGRRTKTHVMLKIPREKFKNNVIMDYRVCGSKFTPEEEVTIVGNGITLSDEDIMIHSKTPKRKTKKWMTLKQFIEEEGNIKQFIEEMVI